MIAGKAAGSRQSQHESDHVDYNHSSQSQDCPRSGEHQFYHSVCQMPNVQRYSDGFGVASPSPSLVVCSALCLESLVHHCILEACDLCL